MIWDRNRIGAGAGALLLALLAACGGDEPGGPAEPPPDIVGSYAGNWSFRFTYTSSGAVDEVICPGVTDILMQRSDGSFAGTWSEQAEGEDCNESSGTLSGIVESDGDVTIVSLVSDVPGGGTTLEEFTGGECVTSSSGDAYRGEADGNTFRISYTIGGDCAGGGSVEWVTTFSGTVSTQPAPEGSSSR